MHGEHLSTEELFGAVGALSVHKIDEWATSHLGQCARCQGRCNDLDTIFANRVLGRYEFRRKDLAAAAKVAASLDGVLESLAEARAFQARLTADWASLLEDVGEGLHAALALPLREPTLLGVGHYRRLMLNRRYGSVGTLLVIEEERPELTGRCLHGRYRLYPGYEESFSPADLRVIVLLHMLRGAKRLGLQLHSQPAPFRREGESWIAEPELDLGSWADQVLPGFRRVLSRDSYDVRVMKIR